MAILDDYFYLQGDEDCDVSVHCNRCDRGGCPIIFYSTDLRVTAYSAPDVVIVHKISDLYNAMNKHLFNKHHG